MSKQGHILLHQQHSHSLQSVQIRCRHNWLPCDHKIVENLAAFESPATLEFESHHPKAIQALTLSFNWQKVTAETLLK